MINETRLGLQKREVQYILTIEAKETLTTNLQSTIDNLNGQCVQYSEQLEHLEAKCQRLATEVDRTDQAHQAGIQQLQQALDIAKLETNHANQQCHARDKERESLQTSAALEIRRLRDQLCKLSQAHNMRQRQMVDEMKKYMESFTRRYRDAKKSVEEQLRLTQSKLSKETDNKHMLYDILLATDISRHSHRGLCEFATGELESSSEALSEETALTQELRLDLRAQKGVVEQLRLQVQEQIIYSETVERCNKSLEARLIGSERNVQKATRQLNYFKARKHAEKTRTKRLIEASQNNATQRALIAEMKTELRLSKDTMTQTLDKVGYLEDRLLRAFTQIVDLAWMVQWLRGQLSLIMDNMEQQWMTSRKRPGSPSIRPPAKQRRGV